MAIAIGTDPGGNVWLVGNSSNGIPKSFNGVAITTYALTALQEIAFKNLQPNRAGTRFDGSNFFVLGAGPVLPAPSLRMATNWAKNSHWHYRERDSFSTVGGAGVPVDQTTGYQWWHGPGAGAATTCNFLQAVQGEWDGNPERFLRITWTRPPQSGDPVYSPDFIFTFLEHYIYTARILAGKPVTVSWQLRSLGGCVVRPLIWRAIPGQPILYLPGPQFTLTPTVQRCDFSTVIPPIPAGADVIWSSYLGIGLDMCGQFGPTIDIGPKRLNEGTALPFDEEPYWMEKAMATQVYP